MPPVLSRALPRVGLCLLSTAVIVGCFTHSASAQTVKLTRDYELVSETGLVHYSQTDWRWGFFPVADDGTVSIAGCGCFLSVLSTVLNQQRGMLPWFPTALRPFGNTPETAFDFNPRYVDLFLTYGPNPFVAPPPPGSPPRLSFPTGWGYKTRPKGTCGITPLFHALQALGTDGLSAAVGVTAVVQAGFGPDVKDIVNRNLIAGRPTIAAVRRGNSPRANHAVLIAGWDNDVQAYRILDPMMPRSGPNGPYWSQVPVGKDDEADPSEQADYDKYEMRIEGIVEIRPGGFGPSAPSFVFGDDPSPIEILMTGPDGRRTGFDPQAGASFQDNDGASYWTFGPWSDPLGEVPEGTAPRFITFPNAPSGRYHFKVTGTADGPLELTAETLFGGTRVLLGEFNGTIAAGEVRKYELQFSRTGASTVAQVSNFTPHAVAGRDLQARTDASIAFDGQASFDTDGAIASFAWDFGDGTTASGPQPQHAYTAPGDYTVVLTVTDANGTTATDSLEAHVILSQRRPVADASGPYLGFATTGPRWMVFFVASASDPNGDPLTYRWDFGDGTPIRTTASPFVEHGYAALGFYTLTLVVNDGIDDSAPATARVEIITAPTDTVTAFLTPGCGSPGRALTLTMGEFDEFSSWNFATMGALPAFPPRRLGLGLEPPDYMTSIRLPGGDWIDVPVQATRLSPGRFIARATFIVPDVPPGLYQIGWSEAGTVPFQIPCAEPSNRPPLADAGGPYAGSVGSSISFDGSASRDPDGDALTYEWDFGDGSMGQGIRPVHSYANPDRYLVTLIVSDGRALSSATAGPDSFASATITAGSLDTIPPTTTAVTTPSAGASGWNTSDVTVDLAAVDNPGGSGVRSVTFSLSGAESGGADTPGDAAHLVIRHEGTTDLAFFATDNAGNVETTQRRVIRIDRSGPAIAGMPEPGCTLWPPNHKLVTVARVSASDGGSGMDPNGLVLTAVSSEPADALGDGHTEPDIVITGGSVAFRSERSGTGAGRIYTITATATDRAGNTTRAVSTCVVPHDQRR